jgi:hypothetical protein
LEEIPDEDEEEVEIPDEQDLEEIPNEAVDDETVEGEEDMEISDIGDLDEIPDKEPVVE